MTEIPADQVERLRSLPMFQDWLHGGPAIKGPLMVPVIEGSDPYDLVAHAVVVDLYRFVYPAPWAIRPYRYVCNVASVGDPIDGGQEIDRSECWRWFKPGLDALEPIPPHEDRHRQSYYLDHWGRG